MRRAQWQESGIPASWGTNADPDAFHVVYQLGYDDLVTGGDQSAVAFVEGWMVIDGPRATFALRPCDVSVAWDCSMTLVGGGWLRFGTIDRPFEFETAISHWCREESPTGEPVLPPARVHRLCIRSGVEPVVAIMPLLGLAWFLARTTWVGGLVAALCVVAALFLGASAWRNFAGLRERDRFLRKQERSLGQ